MYEFTIIFMSDINNYNKTLTFILRHYNVEFINEYLNLMNLDIL